MQGYDKNEALARFETTIDRSDLDGMDAGRLRSLLGMAIDLDLEYMNETGVLTGGVTGDSYYDDDDAYEYIVDGLSRLTGAGEEDEILLARLVDAYMDCQQAYLEDKKLIDWD